MTYIQNIEKKIKKTLDLSKPENQERWRDRADVYVKVKEKSLSPLLLLEAAMEVDVVSFVIYKDKKYPTRHIQLNDELDGVEFTAVIAPEELQEAFGENYDEWDEKALSLDAYIYHYVPMEVMLKDSKEIAEDHLDEPFGLIAEIL